MLSNNFAPMLPIRLVEKDFRYTIQTAPAVDAVIPSLKAIHQTYQSAIANGYGDDNMAGVAKLFIPS